ncbi:type II secretion system protein N [Yunchengibacter salinarum]|uniref:type II secretion system protein N n=1 Tax=Yunchengibacter salinarum TaxID=3133399 RepID=UPI0035B61879
MTRKTPLIGLFLLSLIGFLVATLPLGAVALFLPLERAGLSAAGATGTLWRGRLTGNPDAPVRLLSVTGAPASLLGLTYRADWTATGPALRGRGTMTAAPGGALTFRDTDLTLDLSALDLNGPVPVPLSGGLYLSLERAALSASGTCRDITGSVRSDLLRQSGMAPGFDAPVLSGPLRCEDGVVMAPLSGTASGVRITALWRLAPNGETDLRITVPDAPPDLADLLRRAGFRANGPAMDLTLRGHLAPAAGPS